MDVSNTSDGDSSGKDVAIWTDDTPTNTGVSVLISNDNGRELGSGIEQY